jgi:gentisate 1,2-dioxygenase
MSTKLGTLEELPQDYRDAMMRTGVAPLWPQMRNALPHGAPQPVTRSHLWNYNDVRPLLLKAGELTPVEKAERRVLFLADPGRGAGAMQATSTIYVGLQLLLPGEAAPAHKHTPSAARIVVEGDGAYTVVDGEKLPMKVGDLILTPGGCWHDHGHAGTAPVIWLDALDLPLFVYLEGSYAIEAPLQKPRNRPDPSEVEYRAAGLLPTRRRDKALPPAYPMMRYPWDRTEAALRKLAEHSGGDAIELDYVNPETGQSCLPTIGFTAMMLPPGQPAKPPLRSSSAVFHVVSGRGTSIINGKRHAWQAKDTFSAPVFAGVEHEASGEAAFLVRIHDAPLQEKLGYYEERAR